MRKLIFLFLLILSFTLYPAAVPQGLIKEEKNGVTRITTTKVSLIKKSLCRIKTVYCYIVEICLKLYYYNIKI